MQFDAVKTEEFDAVNVQNGINDVVKIGVQSSVDAVESEVAQFDAVKTEEFDAVNDEVINIIKKYPGLRAPSIYNLIKQKNPNITINIIRNRIRRELKNQIIFKGNSRTGGYYIK